MIFKFKTVLKNHLFRRFSVVTFFDVSLVFFNYLFITSLTNWLSSEDYSNFSYFSSLSAVFFTLISFGSSNFIYRYVGKNNVNQVNLNSHIYVKLIIAIISVIFILFLIKFDFLNGNLLIIALLSGLFISFNLGPFYDILSKTHKFSLLKLFTWLLVYGSVVILYLVNNELSFNEVICGVIAFHFVFFLLSYISLRKHIASEHSSTISVKDWFAKSKTFALTSLISVIIDYVVLFSFKNSTENNVVAAIFILIKLAVGLKTLDSSLQKVLINKYKDKSPTSFFYKIVFVRIGILAIVVCSLVIANDYLYKLLEPSILMEIQSLFPIWIIYMLSYVLNHFGTRLYVNGSIPVYLSINIVKIVLVLLLLCFDMLITKIDLNDFILLVSLINISEGFAFVYVTKKL